MRGEGLEVCGDGLGLLHGRHHVPVHGLEGGVVGGVREVEDAGHLDCNIGVHLRVGRLMRNNLTLSR